MKKNTLEMSRKETYECISIEVIGFSNEDVITNSCTGYDEGINTGNDCLSNS